MKDTDDRPIELLLRRHAQRTSGLANGGSASVALTAHLDADEMNALAENALPQALRSRYSAHLADCDSCRKLVSALSMNASTGTRFASDAAEVKPDRSSFWQMLAALFSLPLMRYGIPALTVILLAVTAFVTLRRGPGSEFLAQKKESPAAASSDGRIAITATPETTTSMAEAPAKPAAPTHGSASVPAPTPAPGLLGLDVPEKGGATTMSKAAPTDYAGAANNVQIQQQPQYAPEPKAPINGRQDQYKDAPAAAAPAGQLAKSGSDLKLADKAGAKENEISSRDADRGKTETLKTEEITRYSRDGLPVPPPKAINESKEKGGPSRARAETRSEMRGAGAASARRAEDSEQTRIVSGHRFRRGGNTWIDAGYDSARGLVTLSRNSEKYQKLANDNAGLRAIVEELGNVIVVWNGKQYRIH
ncbi:MAG: hypothetical protein QOE77_3919 [Blastocatellia bacterium]|jgi:hypothetical protein|nr:hypothetical protein [Blastocatellia bacterium]